MQDITYLQPKSIEELLSVRASTGGSILAGGTDILPRLRKGGNYGDVLIDISRIPELGEIKVSDGLISIGAMVTYHQIETSSEIQRAAPILEMAASDVGALQTRQKGTVGGSIGNASPASDIMLPLLALDAQVTLMSINDTRTLPLREFVLGPGRIAIKKDEFISRISFPVLPGEAQYFFMKHGKRNALACAVVNAAIVMLAPGGTTVTDVRIALGSVAPRQIRCVKTEEFLLGKQLNEEVIKQASELAESEVTPISDVRASAEFRSYLVNKLVARGLLSFVK